VSDPTSSLPKWKRNAEIFDRCTEELNKLVALNTILGQLYQELLIENERLRGQLSNFEGPSATESQRS